MILFTKIQTLNITRFFMIFFEIGIYIYSKSMTLCVTSDFKYKEPDTLCYAIFHEIFEIGGGGGGGD